MIKRKVQSILFYCDANKQNQFLLLRTNERRGSFWQNITGGVDEGEAYEAAALREAIEETGLSEENLEELRSLDLHFNFHDQWGNDVHEEVFLIKCKERFDVTIDPKEHQDFKWAAQTELTKDSVKFESNWQALQKAMGL